MDLFSRRNTIATHKATGVAVLVIREFWYNGNLEFDCAVPQCDEVKGKGGKINKMWHFANATFTEKEIKF